MKTLFIVSDAKVGDHVGEEYDYILEVDDQPSTQTIAAIADRVRTRIRSLWMEMEDDVDRQIVCHLDAASPYKAMLEDLKVILGEEEDIVIDLSNLREGPGIQDPEALRKIREWESRGK